MDKPFRNFDEQVSILNGTFNKTKLKRMDTDSKTKYHLMRNNYYSIINFYKKPFINGKDPITKEDIYLPNVHFNELKALHDFDEEIRLLFFKFLNRIEREFKTAIAYYFSKNQNKKEKEPYLNPNNFSENNFEKGKNVLIKLYGHKINKSKEIIKHYSVKDNIPFWITIHFLTFGNISILYNTLKDKIRQDIISHFENLYFSEYNLKITLEDKFIKNFLKTCSLFRNIAAHNERFYNFTIKDHLNAPNSQNNANNQKLYALYESLKFFLTQDDYTELTNNIKLFIKKLKSKLNSIDINKIIILMGFPNDWL